MSLRRALPWLAAAAIVALLVWKLRTSHFDWAASAKSVRTAHVGLLALAALVIYSNNLLRAMRWAVFLRPAARAAGVKPVSWTALAGSQFIGFTGLAILGRIGELIRPLLIARRTGFTFSSQVGVLTVERVFDLAAFALLFACNLLLAPNLRGLPYLGKAGYTIAALTVVLLAFVATIRLAGEAVASLVRHLLGSISKPFANAAAEKVLIFRDGLNVVDTLPGFALAAALSLALWLTIALAYVLVLKAFPAPVHQLSAAQTVVMMGFSVAGSALPVPSGSGAWAGNTFALSRLFAIPTELAVPAGLMVWLITTLAVIPVGLVYARIEGVSITQTARRLDAADRS